MTDFERARQAMVDNQIRTFDVTDRRLLAALGRVPRERFVPEPRRTLAYVDLPHALQPGLTRRALAAPAPFARLVQLAGLRADDRVLDVGCGSGYSSAVLAELAAEVVAIDGEAELADMARDALSALGVANVTVLESTPEEGAPQYAPFDVIIIEGEVEAVSEQLFTQLADGGRLAVVLRRERTSVAHLYVRAGDDVAGRAEFDLNLPPLTEPTPIESFVF